MRSKAATIQALALVAFLAGTVAAQPVPDLSGVWQRIDVGARPGEEQGSSSLATEGEPPLTEWGKERFALAKPIQGAKRVPPPESNAPELKCLPMGIPAVYFRPRPFEIVQLPDRVVMLFEIDNFWRVIHMDGRDFPEVPLHTWNGYSIGHYEGDTLVIETRHMLGWESEDVQRWVDRLGHPFSDQIRVIERLRRVSDDRIENRITIDDPVAYEAPWSGTIVFERRNFELGEFVCGELMLSDLPVMRPE